MATTDEVDVLQTLFDHLSGLTTTPATTIAWPNGNFEPSGYPYLRVNVIPLRSGRISESGDMKRHDGILQISIVEERGAGMHRTARIAGQLIDHFRQGVTIYHDDSDRAVQITEPGHQVAPFDDANETVTPVQFRFTSFSTVS